MAIGIEDATAVQTPLARRVTLGWFLKRSLIGIAILMFAMGSLAWLTYASIDPEGDGEQVSTVTEGARDGGPQTSSLSR